MTAETKTALKARFIDDESISKADLDALIDSVDLGSASLYIALVTQSNTDHPTAVELRNTTGATMSWTRETGVSGQKRLTADSAVFTASKTFVVSLLSASRTVSEVSSTPNPQYVVADVDSTTIINFYAYDTGGTVQDGAMQPMYVMVLVFP